MPRRTDARGFTIVETLITLLIMSIVLIGLLTLLDSSNKLSKQETQVADAQASARSGIYEVTRILRQAGIGNLSMANALMEYVNNADSSSPTLTDLGGTAHTIRPGTDAVEARGIFFGDQYFFDATGVSCGGGNCTVGSNSVSITISQHTASGMTNYPVGGIPEVMTRTGSFFFVVASPKFQTIQGSTGTNVGSYLTPLYFVGKFSVTAATATAGSFTLTMDATDAAAQTMNASANTAPVMQSAFSGGVVDDVVFFVDRGRAVVVGGTTTYPSPYLAMATLDAASGNWNISPLVDDVEDMQIAYGIDGADGSTPDGGVDPSVVSSTANGDEWVHNVAGEVLTPQTTPRRFQDFLLGTNRVASGNQAVAALRSVYVGLVVKSADPDPKALGSPGGLPPSATSPAVKLFDSTAAAVSATLPYRRRVQTMAVSLRNYQ